MARLRGARVCVGDEAHAPSSSLLEAAWLAIGRAEIAKNGGAACEAARAPLEKYAALAPSDPTGHLELGRAVLAVSRDAPDAARKPDLERARAALRRALELYADRRAAHEQEDAADHAAAHVAHGESARDDDARSLAARPLLRERGPPSRRG